MQTVKIRARPSRLIGLSLFWTLNLAFTVFLLAAPWHQTELAVIVTCIVIGLILLPLVAYMYALILRCHSRRVLITLTLQGMTDHRISATEIRWDDLSWYPYPSLEYADSLLVEPKTPLPRIFWPYRILARFYGALDLPAYPVLTMGTGLSGIDLAEAFTAFKPSGTEAKSRRKRLKRA